MIADKGTGSLEETKLSRLSELTVFAHRGFGTFSTTIGTGVYGSELESTLKGKSLSSKPMIWSACIKCPLPNRIARGSANVTWGCANTKFADDACLLLGDFFP